MSKLGVDLCFSMLREGSLDAIRDEGVKVEMLRGNSVGLLTYVLDHFRDFGVIPHIDTVLDGIEIDEELISDTPEPARFYARKVVERDALNAQREKIKDIGTALRTRDPHAVHEATKEVLQIGLDKLQTGVGSVINMRETTDDRWENYQHVKNLDGGIRGIRSAWAPLDAETGGFKPGDLVTFVGRPGTGKSWLAVISSVTASGNSHRVGFVSPEMSRVAIETRHDSVRFRLPYRDLVRGELDFETEDYYYKQLQESKGEGGQDLFVATAGRVNNIADIEMFIQETNIDFLIVDGVYLLNAGTDRTPWHERVMLVVKGLKELALKRDIPVLATAQFNRSVRTGATRAGTEDIGHSDALGQYSDVIVAMFQDENARRENMMLFRIIKNREGRQLELTVNWDLITMDFSPMDAPGEINDHGVAAPGETNDIPF